MKKLTKKPMTMKQYERSSMDRKADASGKHGKEGSAKDMKMDKAALKKINKKRMSY